MDKSFNLIVSAVISISIYILIILVLVIYLQKPVVKTYQAKVNDTIIELDLIMVDDKDIKKEKKEKKEKIVKKDIKIEQSTSVSANKKTDLKSLFAKVSTKSEIIKEKKVLNVKKNKISSRFKSKYKNNLKKSELKIAKISDSKTNSKSNRVVSAKKGEFDEYYSKVNSYILTRWYKYPLFTKEEYLVKVQITITPKGLFSYNVKKYSGNLNIDNAVNEFLKTQINEIYPLPLDNKEKNIIINFINDKG